MQTGADREATPYLWPSTLRLPPRPRRLVYLDMNHWIGLTKANAGHPDGRSFQGVLEQGLNARDEGKVMFPISDTTFIEVEKIGRSRQRRDLCAVIERLSRFEVVASRADILAVEVEAMLDEVVGPNPVPLPSIPYVDWGVARAFGRNRELRILDSSGRVVTAEARARWAGGPDAFDDWVRDVHLTLQRSILQGPSSPEEAAALRGSGWDPTSAYQIAERRAEQEREQARVFDANPKWRRGRTRDVVAAREILIELDDRLNEGLLARGVRLSEVVGSPEEARTCFDAMPSFDVAVTLKTAYHRDGQHNWTVNDVHDIDALGSTIPYCDIVVTDKAVASIANRTGLAERLSCTVISSLAELSRLL